MTNVVQEHRARERRRNVGFAAALVAVVGLIIGSAVFASMRDGEDGVVKATALTVPASATDEYGIKLTSEDLESNSGGAKPVDIVIFEDFSCPACRSFEQNANATLMNLVETGQANIEYRLVSFLDEVAANRHSSRAASASLCVRDSDGMAGWKQYHDWLYETQPVEGQEGQSNDEFLTGAEDLGLSPDPTCVRTEKYVPYMEKATEAMPVEGTPTVFVAGEEVDADPLAIVKAVDAANEKFAS